MKDFVGGTGRLNPDLMILGEAPSYVEVSKKTPFVGPSGQELNKLFNDAGMNRDDFWLSNVCKFPVPANPQGKKIPFQVRAKHAGIDLDEQLEWLEREIAEVNPNCILALGGTALWALSGKKKIQSFRGSIMWGMSKKFVSTYHPAHLLHQAGGEIKGYWNRYVMIFDFKRAAEQSKFPELRLPQRLLEICRSSADLENFINRYKDKIRLSVDIEAGGHCIPICIGLSFDPKHGMTIPLWNKDGISTIPDSDMVYIWTLLARLLWEKEIVGQHFNYDRDKIKRLGFIIKNIASDTMLKAFCINPELPKALAFNASIYTEEPFYKDEGMYEGQLKDLLLGCARDACVTLEVDGAMDADIEQLGLREFYENFIMKLPDLYAGIEQQGFNVDTTQRDNLLAKYIKWDEEQRYRLFQASGVNLNTQSPKQIYTYLFDTLKLPRRNGTGEEELTSLLNHGKVKQEHKDILTLILENRRVRKTIGTYLMALPDYDGRMRTTYFPCLETGRTSTGQQDPPIRPQHILRDENNKKKKRVLGTAFQTITKHGDIGNDVRSMYIPDDGEIFVGADSSQAEARVVALLANDMEMLSSYDNHDVHALTASWFFGGTELDYSKKALGYEVPTRFVGKTLRHAGHLGAKKRRAALSVNTDARKYKIDISITEMDAGRALQIFHAKCPNIQGVFHAGVIECLNQDRRRLVAPLPYGIDAPHGGIRTFFERYSDELFRQAFSYLPQRAVSDNTKAAALRIKQRIPSIKIILEAHDGLLFSVPISRVDEYAPIITEEMERPIDFTHCSLSRDLKLVVPCELEIGVNYQELRKYELKAA